MHSAARKAGVTVNFISHGKAPPFLSLVTVDQGFPGGASGKEPTCQCRTCKRHRFNPWVVKIPWKRAWQPTPVFLPGEFQGQRRLMGYNPWGSQRVGYD